MKKYQAVAFLLSTAMTVSSVAPVFGASNDIFGHWAEFTITKWQNEGRIGGYEDGTFKPDRAITRAEFVRLLNSAAPTAFTSSASINFSDVSESDWFYADVAKAVGGRVASGFEDGTFRPGETVTRMQAAVFICNAKGLTPNEAAANNFTDAASIPSWAKGAVGAAVAAGYLSGYPDGSFGGSKGMTRAEAVSTLDRVLGGGSTTTTPSGEIDTTNRDNNNSTEDNRTAEAGNMVWTSGGSGGGSKKSSSSSSSSSSDKKTNNVTIRSQKDANEYEGKTLTGTTTIYPDNGLELKDIRFKGDVDIKVQSDAVVASAYADSDVAVAAAYAAKINIYFEGKTSVSGTITVVENNVPSSQVVITTRTPRALNASVVAKVATAILGFTIDRVEATAPVEVAEGASVGTVELGDDASLEVADTAKSVDKVDVTGDAKDVVLNGEGSTDVAVRSGASVENVAVNDNVDASVVLSGSATVDNVKVSDSASADVAVKDSASVGKVELSGTATAKVDVAADAKVDTITSTSTAKGSEVTGEGTVNKIEATDKSTIDTSNSGDNIPDVSDKPVTPTPTPTPDPGPGTEEKAVEASNPAAVTVAPGETATATITLTGATVKADAELEATCTTAGAPAATVTAKGKTITVTFDAKDVEASDTPFAYTVAIPQAALTLEDGYTYPTTAISKTISVTVTANGEDPVVVDKSALTAAIDAAEAAKTGVETSENGSDVLPTKKWVTTTVMNAFTEAITAATTVKNNAEATQVQVDEAVTTLNAAKDTFVAAQKPGTKSGKEALTEMITDAETLKGTVTVSGNGEDVEPTDKWVTSEEMEAFTTAITTATTVKDNASATDEQISAAITALAEAQATFEGAMKDGTKVTLVTGITIAATGGATTVEAGKTLQFTETVTPDNATDKTVKWSAGTASEETISPIDGVTISTTGLLNVASTVEPDTEITVKATANDSSGISGTATVTVTAAKPAVLQTTNASATFESATATTVTYTVTGAVDGATYKVYDAATDGSEVSGASAEVTSGTLTLTVPTANQAGTFYIATVVNGEESETRLAVTTVAFSTKPAALQATNASFTFTSATDTEATYTVTGAVDGATYKVYDAATDGSEVSGASAEVTSGTLTLTVPTANQAGTFYIATVVNGEESETRLAVTTVAFSTKPAALQATNASFTFTSATDTEATYTVTGAVDGATYKVYDAATDGSEVSGASAEVTSGTLTLTVPTANQAGTFYIATVVNGEESETRLAVTTVAFSTKPAALQATNASFTFTSATDTEATYTVTGAVDGATYKVYNAATDGSEVSGASAVVADGTLTLTVPTANQAETFYIATVVDGQESETRLAVTTVAFTVTE